MPTTLSNSPQANRSRRKQPGVVKSVGAIPEAEPRSLSSHKIDELVEEVHPCPCCGALMIFTPIIMCSHCGKKLPIKCYVFERSGKFYGECLTLNLISRGDSHAEAIVRLQRAMRSYVETVIEDGKSTEGLIPRSAPISSWVRYYTYRSLRRVRKAFGAAYPFDTQTVPAPDAIPFTVAEC